MENLDKKQCEESGCKMCCGGGNCCGMEGMAGYHHHGGRHLIKIILKLLIVMIIFFCGFKLGVLTGALRTQYGNNYGMMRGY